MALSVPHFCSWTHLDLTVPQKKVVTAATLKGQICTVEGVENEADKLQAYLGEALKRRATK